MDHQRHKLDFDKNVWQERAFKVGDSIFVVHVQLAASASDTADKWADHPCNELIRQMSGRYIVLSVQQHAVAKEEEGIPNTVSIDRATLSLTQTQVTDIPHRMMQIALP